MIEAKGISEYSCLSNSKNHRWSQTECLWSAFKGLDARSEQPSLDAVSLSFGIAVETKVGTISSNILDKPLFFANSCEFNLEEGTGVFLPVEKVTVLDYAPYFAVSQEINHVYSLGVRSLFIIKSVIEGRIETTKSRLSSESDKIRNLIVVKVPVIMSPVLSRGSHSGLGFVDNEWDSLI